jgi:hypothetical protein
MKQRVAKTEGSKNPTHGLRIELEFVLDVLAGYSEIETINVSETRSDSQKQYHAPAHARGASAN